MIARPIATLTAFLLLAPVTVVHAQQSTDTLHRDRAHDERVITRDTLKVNHAVAVRDSARAALQQDQAKGDADKKQLDSVQADLARARKASPRDTAAINRDEASVKRLQEALDRDRDRARHEKNQAQLAQKAVERRSSGAIAAHKDIREDHPTSPKSTDSSKTR